MAQKSPEQMLESMLRNLPEKTGKTLEQWLAVLSKAGLGKHGEIVRHLKSEHGVTHGFASTIAHQFLSGAQPASPDELVEAQYAGAKADLRPIYDAVCAMVGKFGNDVDISPKKAYVSLRRNKQFALVQPSTRDRVDLGINLKGTPADGRLEPSGSFNAMVSHRVRLTKKGDVDAELKRWLKAAYDAA